MFKKLKGLFIVEEKVSTKPKAKVNTKPKTSSKGNSIVKTTTKPPVVVNTNSKKVSVKGEVNDRFLKILFDALEKNNLDGFDYLEFKKSLQSLSAMPMDEATRFKSAFAMASSMNITSKHLLDSADFYLSILGQEEQNFQKALAQQKSTKVHAQEKQVKQLESTVKLKAEQIKTLTTEIDKLQQKITITKTEIEKQTTKVTKTKNDFMASFDAVSNQIKTDVANMKKYLIGGNQPIKPKEDKKV